MQSERIKYGRTPHLPNSPGFTGDDIRVSSVSHFIGKRVIGSFKMDGENAALYPDYTHARSLDSRHHVSRDWLKSFWASIKHNIPEGTRIYGENLYAKHSIHYDNLPSYFMGFSMWQGETCYSWDDTKEMFDLIGITPVEVFYDDIFDLKKIHSHFINDGKTEGYVVRLADSFTLPMFDQSIAKYVREDHVQTETHWMNNTIVPNQMKA